MSWKLLGALLTVAACGAVGFSRAAAYRKEEKELQQVILVLEYMQQELSFRLPPLPELCSLGAAQSKGAVRTVLLALSQQLDQERMPDVGDCMECILQSVHLQEKAREKLQLLGKTLGRFDLPGQISGMESVKALAQRDLDGLIANEDEHIRMNQTLALCAGAVLVILLI